MMGNRKNDSGVCRRISPHEVALVEGRMEDPPDCSSPRVPSRSTVPETTWCGLWGMGLGLTFNPSWTLTWRTCEDF